MPRSIVYSTPTVAMPGDTRGVPSGDYKAPPQAPPPDDYADKLVKLIPVEVIGVYVSMQAILEGAKLVHPPVPWLVYGFGIFATWFFLRFSLKVSDRWHLLLAMLAFAIWAFSLGGPFEQFQWYVDAGSTYAGLLVAGYTFIAPLLLPEISFEDEKKP